MESRLRAHRFAGATWAILVSLALALMVCLPVSAQAAQPPVNVENHTLGQGQAASDVRMLSGLSIDGVDAPQPGVPLDDAARVSSDQGVEWDIPVLWIDANLQLASFAQQDSSYLPALAFFVPDGNALEGDTFAVKLSASLIQLFGGDEVISMYDDSTGITYILSASIRQFFMPAQTDTLAQVDSSAQASAPERSTAPAQPAPSAPAAQPTWIDVHCAQTAIDALSEDDLNFLLDLIINKLQPQAVNLLVDKFPAFSQAGANNQLGRQMSLYVYHVRGDDDDLNEHVGAPEGALAYVVGDAFDRDGIKYGYMTGVNVADLLKTDKNEKPVRNAAGKFTLLRAGEHFEAFQNTIVHEMFHAFMDDYNRTGMLGCTNLADAILDKEGRFPTDALQERYNRLAFPEWFAEGSASTVENIYDYREENFDLMREIDPGAGKFNKWYDEDTFLVNYVAGRQGSKPSYADLGFCGGYDSDGNKVDNTQSAYVMGYVATMYLSELKARATSGSAVWTDGKQVAISNDKLRMGLNDILADLHQGATLDQVIHDISPTAQDGSKVFKDCDSFEGLFIKGPAGKDDSYMGEADSLAFAVTYLNYLQAITLEPGRKNMANGSVLFDFSKDYATPLDPSKNASSAYYQIVPSNKFTESTVPDSVALQGGGKSDPDAVPASNQQDEPASQEESALPLAAKAPAKQQEHAEAGSNTSDSPAPAQADVASVEPAGEEEPCSAVTDAVDGNTVGNDVGNVEGGRNEVANAQVVDEPQSK